MTTARAHFLVPIFATLAGCAAIAAFQPGPSIPMTKEARSYFQPYMAENGEAQFVFRVQYLNSEGSQQKEIAKHYSVWLQDWLREYRYCKNGYEILSNKKEPLIYSPEFGGFVIAQGRCK